MIPISQLKLGSNDAQNYRKRGNKEYFNKIFLKTEELDDICKDDKYFLLGEKGTGKTAYAVYMTNNYYKNIYGSIQFIGQTEYHKFVKIKMDRNLEFSNYASVWRVILYLLMSEQIISRQKDLPKFFSKFTRMKLIKDAIDSFYDHAFSPEIINALHFVENNESAIEFFSSTGIIDAKVGSTKKEEQSTSEHKFQINLLKIQKKFEEAFSQLRLKDGRILFIDGIDIRPPDISYNEYLQCIRGLVNAIWTVNNEIFGNLKGPGRIKVVLLIRPDIFNSLGLQNQNNIIRDNSVLLDWRTKNEQYRNSKIFEQGDNLLKVSQNDEEKKSLSLGDSWDHYFPYKVEANWKKDVLLDSFPTMLKLTYARPRDIVTILSLLKENVVYNKTDQLVFEKNDSKSPDFRDKLSKYYLAELRDQLFFYYTDAEYQIFLKFFEFLNGKREFLYHQYLRAFQDYSDFIKHNKFETPEFAKTPDDFLQFIYNLNVICYIEETIDGEQYWRWCYRQRSFGNLAPKVKTSTKYRIFDGIAKALNIGKLHS
jgi:hypothetical protein